MLLLFNEKGIHRSQGSESGIFDSSDLHFVYMWRLLEQFNGCYAAEFG
jgi:hypothetical protein